MAVNFFFKEKNKNKVVQLPFIPEEIKIKINDDVQNVSIVNLGNTVIPKSPKPVEISFKSFFPSDTYLPDIRTKGKFWYPDEYIDYFSTIMDTKSPVLFTVTDFPGIFIDCIISKFEYSYKGGSDDCNYSMTLLEYKEISISSVPLISKYTKPEPIKKESTPTATAPEKQVTVGCDVILNGAVYRDSYGNGKGKTFSNYKGKVSIVKTDGRSHPYHITSPSGGWLGWVTPSSVKVV